MPERFPAPFDSVTDTDPSKDYLREALTATMQGQGSMCFDFRIQVRARDQLEEQHIENASTTWPDELQRYRNVARITIPLPQQPDSAEMVERCEKLAFTPWHALAAHRPIGGINRLRDEVYRRSARNRGADGY